MIDPNVLKNTLANPENDGLFSLKSLHKSSGGEKKNQPALWLRLQKTINDIRFLEESSKKSVEFNCNILRTLEGSGGDTFVCRELVYSYAMWISSEFGFTVIRVFDHMLHNQPEQAQQIITDFNHREPRDTRTLSVILQIPSANSKPYFDSLVQKEIIGRTYLKQPDKAIYHHGINGDDFVIGKKGNTLLFSEKVKELFPKNLDWI